MGRYFTKHYAIERFGVMFLCLAIAMVSLFAYLTGLEWRDSRKTLTNQAIYTPNFTTSLSGVPGQTLALYSNADKTRIFLLFRFNDMSKLPMDVNKYSVTVFGSNLDQNIVRMESRPSGLLYMIGHTGYMGLQLNDLDGFPFQILGAQFTIQSRNSAETASRDGEDYDRFYLYFNPGAGQVETVNFLNEETIDMTSLYGAYVTSYQEPQLRYTLMGDLEIMRSSQAAIEEYMARLEQDDVATPSTPIEISGDTLTATSRKSQSGNRDFAPLIWSEQYNTWVDEETQQTAFSEGQYYLYLNTEYVFPGGYNFEWQTGSIKEGYLQGLAGDESNWESYLNEHDQDYSETVLDTTSLAWYYKDGTPVDMVSPDDKVSSKTARVRDDIKLLTDAWTQFYTAKQTYQCLDLAALLRAEQNMRDSFSNFSVSDPSAVTLYTGR